MQPIHRYPTGGGIGHPMMGRGLFGAPNQMMGPRPNLFGGGRMAGPPSLFGGRNAMMGQMMGRTQQGMRGGGGFLSRLFGGIGRGNQFRGMGMGGLQAASRNVPGSGGGIGSLLQSLSNPAGLSSMLNNTQQVLKTAQSIGPMIQQYGPLVKNLPAIWKLYRGLKDSSSDEKSEESQEKTSKKKTESTTVRKGKRRSTKKRLTPQTNQRTNEKRKSEEKTGHHQKGLSVPKLYI